MQVRGFDLFARVLRDQDAGGAAGGADGAGGAANGAVPPPSLTDAARQIADADKGGDKAGDQGGDKSGGDPGKAGDPPAAYFPPGIPEALKGESEKATLDRIAEHFNGLPKPPEKPDGYELKLPNDMREKFGDLKDDKVLPLWREVAHELQLSQDQFNGAFEKLYTRMVGAGLIDDPVSIEKELAKLEPATGDAVHKKNQAAVRVNAVVDAVTGMAERGALSRGEAAQIQQIAVTAEGVIALEKMLKMTREHGVRGADGSASPSGDTKESLQKQMGDPRYDLRSPHGDRQFVEDVDARWRRLHGG